MSEPQLVVITGGDGSGKTTVCRAVQAQLEKEWGAGTVAVASIWDSIEESGLFTKEQVGQYLGHLEGKARTLFLFHSMLNGVALAEKKKPKWIVADSYFYKYAAIERAYGVDAGTVNGASVGFRKPEAVYFLEVDPKTAWARKKKATAYESGGSGGEEQKFITFQSKLSKTWAEIEATHGGSWIHLSTTALSLQTVIDRIVSDARNSFR